MSMREILSVDQCYDPLQGPLFITGLQALVRFLRSGEFAARAAEMAGYDVSAAGTVHYNAP